MRLNAAERFAGGHVRDETHIDLATARPPEWILPPAGVAAD